MFIRDEHGNWYEMSAEALKGKKVDPEKVREAAIVERAEKTKKVLNILSSLDQDEREILCVEVIGQIPERLIPTWASQRPDCIGINWGTSGGHPACDCACGHAACDCSSAWEQDWGAALLDEALATERTRR